MLLNKRKLVKQEVQFVTELQVRHPEALPFGLQSEQVKFCNEGKVGVGQSELINSNTLCLYTETSIKE